ncbi:MAG: phage portal protein [Bifidobacteriales bacterium]|nr:phage portal protein [Bifidobacteriales bacterium]
MAQTGLSSDEQALVRSLYYRLTRLRRTHQQLDDYYRGAQMLQILGIAVPPELRAFEFPLNWPRVTVDTVVQRQHVRSFSMPDQPDANDQLWEIWEANNMESQSVLAHLETRIQGHGFVAVGMNPDDKEHPLITVESSKSMIARIDPRTRRITAALRVYYDPYRSNAPTQATLYQPDSTVYLDKGAGWDWAVTDRDEHHLGQVPVVQFINRPRVGDFTGESEMQDVLRPTDMAARALMDLQVAMETHAVPGKWAVGLSDKDFIDAKTGRIATPWQAYYTAMTTSKSKDAKFGQFTASDLSNFKTVIDLLAEQVSAVTGLPVRYFGQNSANPASEGAIRADEVRLVKNVELKNSLDGDSWGDVMALAWRMATGDQVDGHRIRTDWDDPNTPTFAQKADAIQKLVATGILSREGAWDELGWSEARKDKERERFTDDDMQDWGYVKPMDGEDDHEDHGGAGPAPDGGQAGQKTPKAQQQSGQKDHAPVAGQRRQ